MTLDVFYNAVARAAAHIVNIIQYNFAAKRHSQINSATNKQND